MTNVLNGKWINPSAGSIECPYCEYAMFIIAQSKYTKDGLPRQRYKKTYKCMGCCKKFKITKS